MDERTQKAFDFAAETAKQLITLATGIVALTITFSKDILGGIAGAAKSVLMLGWLTYLLSIIFGTLVLMALTGNLEPRKDSKMSKAVDSTPTIRSSNVTVPAILQVVTFLIGTIMIVWVGIASVGC